MACIQSIFLKLNSLLFSTVLLEEPLQSQAKSSGGRPQVFSGLQNIALSSGSKNCCGVQGAPSPASTPLLHAMPLCWHALTTAACWKHCWCSMWPQTLKWLRMECRRRADTCTSLTGAYLRHSGGCVS